MTFYRFLSDLSSTSVPQNKADLLNLFPMNFSMNSVRKKVKIFQLDLPRTEAKSRGGFSRMKHQHQHC